MTRSTAQPSGGRVLGDAILSESRMAYLTLEEIITRYCG